MSRSSVVDLKKTSNGRICEPAKTELATDLQKSAELRQLLTYWVHERGYSIKTVTHSLETHSHRIIEYCHNVCEVNVPRDYRLLSP